ncbi:hypothetical protein GPL17_36465 [Bradyrhizobium yuanmingense]|uniref:hypothetical protein n=1 Tax=Bradyrhizobium yuanmingense TaxID=108015 RepID=UPI0012F73998|nr:hypothetical protein [Bradyrhizobium yuanmingense]MVT55891.1 hypothetical protein [Bradyrhizobium yuanmingense]
MEGHPLLGTTTEMPVAFVAGRSNERFCRKDCCAHWRLYRDIDNFEFAEGPDWWRSTESGKCRILIGPDAQQLDERMRRDPENAYARGLQEKPKWSAGRGAETTSLVSGRLQGGPRFPKTYAPDWEGMVSLPIVD